MYEYKYQQELSALHAMWDRSSIAHFSFLDPKLEATWTGYYVTTCPLPCGPHGSILLQCTSILLSSHLSLLSTLIGVQDCYTLLFVTSLLDLSILPDPNDAAGLPKRFPTVRLHGKQLVTTCQFALILHIFVMFQHMS